jgi:hypothetical protein
MDTLFGAEPEPAEPHVVAGVQWGPYRPKNPAKCDRCVLILVAAKGDAPAAQAARYRRRTTTTDDLLCYQHAQEQRVEDGLPKFRLAPA